MKSFHYVPSKDVFVKKTDDDQTIEHLKGRFQRGDYFSKDTIPELMEFARLVKLYPHLEKEFKTEAKPSYFEKQLGSFGQVAVPGVDAVRHLAGLCFYEIFKAGRDDKVAAHFLHEYLIASVEYHVTVAVNTLAREALQQTDRDSLEKVLLAAAPEHGVVGYAVLASYYSQLAEASWAEAESLTSSSSPEQAITQSAILMERGNGFTQAKLFVGAVSFLLLQKIMASGDAGVCHQVHQSLVANFEKKNYDKLCWSQPYLQEGLQEFLEGLVSIERQRAERAANDVADKAFHLLVTSVSVVGHGFFFQRARASGFCLDGAASARSGVGL